MIRPTKLQYYLNIAKEISLRSTCLVSKYGSVIVNSDKIISTGYNGSSRGSKNCVDLNYCSRDTSGSSRYNSCRSVHSEVNSLLHADYNDLIGSTIYLARGFSSSNSNSVVIPCLSCWRLIINSQVSSVICLQSDNSITHHKVDEWIDKV